MNSFCNDTFWDIGNFWYTNEPKLSPCFEKIVLGFVPCLFLWMCFPFECVYLQKRKLLNRRFSLYSKFKLVTIALIAYVNVCGIVLNVLLNDSNVLNICWFSGLLITYGLLFGISILHVTRQKPTSGVSFLFSLFTVLCGLPQLLTEIDSIEPDFTQYTMEAYLYLAMYTLQILLFVMNFFADSALTNEADNPREKASYISRAFMAWMYPYVWKNRTSDQTLSDLWNIDYRTTISYSLSIFHKYWNRNYIGAKKNAAEITNKSVKNHRQTSRIIIMRGIVLKIVKPFVISILISNLFAALFISFNNQIIKSIVDFMQYDEFNWHGYYLATLPLLNSIINMIFSISSYNAINNMKLSLDAFLSTIVYEKILNLSTGAQKIYDDSEIIDTLICKTDSISHRISVVCKFLASLIVAVICMFYVWRMMGWHTIIFIVIFAALLTLITILRKKRDQNFLIKTRLTRKRMKLTQDVINGYKVLKLYAWETAFENEILDHRKDEIRLLKKNVMLDSMTGSLFFGYSTMILFCPILSILFFNDQRILSISEIFHLIGLINSLAIASINFPYVVTNFSLIKLYFGRIVNFMYAEEKENYISSQPYNGKNYALSIENGFFCWTVNEDEEILRNINVKVAKGELVSVIGSLGSGKTSLLLAFLGEPHKITGNLDVQGTVAYASQQAWILNKTVRKNIIMNKPFDEKFYNLVIDACSLRQDINSFPNADLTEIGEKGINLSGGQKQRLSLARAVYSNADVYLLDDIFSALDLRVAGHIFLHLVGPQGLLNQKTRVIVTHNTQFLSQMDRIIMMKNQTVFKSDSYVNLKNTDSEFTTLLSKLSDEGQKKEVRDKIDDMLKNRKDIRSSNGGIEKINEIDNKSTESLTEKYSIENVSKRTILPKLNVIEAAIIKLTSSKKSNNEKGIFTLFRENTTRGDILLIAGILFFLLSNNIFRILTNIGLAYWSEQINVIHISNLTYTEIVITLVAISFAMCYYYQISVFNASFNIALRTHDKLLTIVLKWPMILFEAIPSSQLINRFGLYLSILDDRTSSSTAVFLMKKTQIYTTFLFSIIVNPYYLIIVLLSYGCEYIAEKLTEKRKAFLTEAISKQTSILSSHAMETLNGLTSIRAMNLQQHFIQKFNEKLERRQILQNNYNQYDIWMVIHKRICWVLLTFVGILAIIFKKQDPIEVTGFVITYILTMINDYSICDKLLSEIDKSMHSLRKMTDYVDTPCEDITSKNTVRSSWPEHGRIIFKNLTVRYRQNGTLILKNLNFGINSGEKVGVIGRTGAGKTSLISSIFRITEFVAGSIEIDDVDITKISLYDLRSKLTVIPQDPVLFSGTLRLNLDPLKEHSDEKLWDILEQAHLKSYVTTLPNKLDHVVEIGGGNISVGQKQLICLGRALLRKSKILILDEATASVDLNTDALIQSTIQREFKHCTVLTIAHRIQTVFNYDKILVLDNGSIMEYDTPENLIRNENSAFYKLATIARLI